jgi:hypothetical protein
MAVCFRTGLWKLGADTSMSCHSVLVVRQGSRLHKLGLFLCTISLQPRPMRALWDAVLHVTKLNAVIRRLLSQPRGVWRVGCGVSCQPEGSTVLRT